MPNGVPQSPTWLSRIRWWPTNSVTRARASPTIVVRRCPTCISFAMLGEEYSTMTVWGAGVSGTPSRGSASSPAVASATDPRVGHRPRSRLGAPGPGQAQLDEPGPARGGGLADARPVQRGGDRGGDLA